MQISRLTTLLRVIVERRPFYITHPMGTTLSRGVASVPNDWTAIRLYSAKTYTTA